MRFVVLEHTVGPSVHWDLMLETGDLLRTWQLASNPCDAQTSWPITCEPIFDHRKKYLDYEGKISAGRGSVRRIERGTYTVKSQNPESIEITLSGEIMAGDFKITASQISRM